MQERGLGAVFCEWPSCYDELLMKGKLKYLLDTRFQEIATLCTTRSLKSGMFATKGHFRVVQISGTWTNFFIYLGLTQKALVNTR